MAGAPQYDSRASYLQSGVDAQAILDAFRDGTAELLGFKKNGDVVVRHDAVVGYYHSESGGYSNQPTSVFLIKGTTSVYVVP